MLMSGTKPIGICRRCTVVCSHHEGTVHSCLQNLILIFMHKLLSTIVATESPDARATALFFYIHHFLGAVSVLVQYHFAFL